MKEKRNEAAERPDEDNPELTTATMRRAKPASEMLPKIIGEKAAAELLRRAPGRPPDNGVARKVSKTLRLDAEVLEAYKGEGKGWQTRINETLRAHMPGRK